MGIIKKAIYKLANKRFRPFFDKQNIYPYYHIVNDIKVPHIENLYDYKNEKQFRDDINYLLRHFQPIQSLEEIKNPTLSNSFLLSFDDGLEETYSVIFPILKEYNLKAIFFLNPDFVDNGKSLFKHDISIIITHLKKLDFDADILKKISVILNSQEFSKENFAIKLKNTKYKDREKINEILDLLHIDVQEYRTLQKPYLSKPQIMEMLEYGMIFGGHTMSHPPLGQLTHEESKAEIINSIDWVKNTFGLNYSCFAFPFTDKNISKKLLEELFEYDENLLLFGNSGLKKDIDKRIVQRFSLEDPSKKADKTVVAENMYKLFNKIVGKYYIKRK